MKVYRVTVKEIGVYEYYRTNVDFETWKKFLKSDAAKWLPKPPYYSGENRSYFTQKGFEMFSVLTMPTFNTLGKLDITTLDVQDDAIVYQDPYQIVTK